MELKAESLNVRLGGRPVLDGIDAIFLPGRITVILGPNGAGKSSLLKCVTGLIAPASGRIALGDTALDGMRPRERARRIGYLAQDPAVHWNMAVRDVVALGRLPHRGAFGGPSREDETAVDEALLATETQIFAERSVHTLSGGERARVLLARLLAGRPDWLLADEPLASLDPAHQIDMLSQFRAAADAGAGVLLVLHDLSQAARVADDVLLLKGGRVVAAGEAQTVLTTAMLTEIYQVPISEIRASDGQRLYFA